MPCYICVISEKEVEQRRMNSDVDLAFMIDITGSMTKYIKGTKDSVKEIVSKVHAQFNESKIRVALVGYRDYQILHHAETGKRIYKNMKYAHFEVEDFTESVDLFIANLAKLKAAGGGDHPEDVLGAIKKTLGLKWKAANKLIFQIGNAIVD